MGRKQRIAKVYFWLLGPLLLISAGCNELPLETFGQQEATAVDVNIARANTQFGFNLFNEIRKTEQDANIFISPFSISVALAMTLNGAAAETERAMADTLQLRGMDSAAINADYAGTLQTLLASDSELAIANSLWARQGIPFKQTFLQQNTDFFGAEISTLDFNDPNASKTINQWTSDNTNGKIEKIVGDDIDPTTVLFLINAIYFKGTWQREFNPEHTQTGTFYLANGSEKQVPMMRQQRTYPYYRGEDFQAIRLAYGDGQMAMYVFLPDPESSLDTFLAGLDAARWDNWMSEFHEEEVALALPKFKLEYGKTVNAALKALGMAVAFDPNFADFSRMAPLEVLGGNLYIDEVVHKTFIEVNEEGTEAAAATSVAVGVKSIGPPPMSFTVDRPFFFAIQDNETQLILFTGIVMDP